MKPPLNAIIGFAAGVATVLLIAAAPSGKTHSFVVEYQPGDGGNGAGGVPALNLTLFKKADQARAGELLRQQLQWTADRFHPDRDILATAWDSFDEASAKAIGSPLVYLHASNKIVTADEAFKK